MSRLLLRVGAGGRAGRRPGGGAAEAGEARLFRHSRNGLRPASPGKPAVRENRAEKELTAGKYREPFELVGGYSSSLRTAMKASCGTSTLPS